MLRWSEVRQQHRHLVERPATDRFVVTTAGQVVTDLLLIDPEQAVKRDDVGITDEWQAVIACVQRLAVWRYLNEEPTTHSKVFSHLHFSSSRMRVINHNWSATKQRLRLQSVAETSSHSVLSGNRIRWCGTSFGSRLHINTIQYN